MERFLKKYWPYIAGTAAAIGAVITFGWDVFTYVDGKNENQAGDQKPAVAAGPMTAEANPQAPLPTPEPLPASAELTPPPNVTATGGIAIGGNVSDSDLRVDAQDD